MARPSQRRSQVGTDRFFELGVAGRKTGVTLKDTGVRDEHGMEPLDALFSSPEKTKTKGQVIDEDDSDSEEEMEMDIDYTGGVGPAALLNGNGNRLSMPLPRSRSPPKTYLHSPPTKNPHLQQSSSPQRGSVVRDANSQKISSVARKLDFGSSKMPKLSAKTNGRHGQRLNGYGGKGDDSDDEAILRGERASDSDEDQNEDGLMDMIDGGDDMEDADPPSDDLPPLTSQSIKKTAADRRKASAASRKRAVVVADEESDEPEEQEPLMDAPDFQDDQEEPEEEEEEPEPEPQPPVQPKRRERPKATVPEPEPEPEPEVEEPRPRKRRSLRTSLDENESNEVAERQTKRPRTEAKAKGKPGRPKKAVQAEPAPEPTEAPPAEEISEQAPPKKRGRKRKSETEVGDTSLLPRGPPLPKSRGLAINRPQTASESVSTRTRSGRSSYKPLAWWRGEHVDYEYDYAASSDRKLGKAYMPSIKEIHRTDELLSLPDKHKRSKTHKSHKSGKSRRRQRSDADSEDSDSYAPAEPWEKDPGGVSGEMVLWKPSHETNPPAWDEEIEVMEQQVALSNAAILPRPVRDASFKYIKTVGLPFYGAGVLELPPGTEKRPKNSRKMFMTFFVQYGRVSVTVHETTFRISKGGMFFVPRGNYYSIINDYDQPARLFFSQACEKMPDPEDEVDADETSRVA